VALPDDPAIADVPGGPTVDGRRLLNEAVGFGRALRAARLSIDLGAAVDFARALTLVDIGDREQVRAAGAAIFVRRRDDRPVYDAAFDRWWRRRARRLPDDFKPPTMPREDETATTTTINRSRVSWSRPMPTRRARSCGIASSTG